MQFKGRPKTWEDIVALLGNGKGISHTNLLLTFSLFTLLNLWKGKRVERRSKREEGTGKR